MKPPVHMRWSVMDVLSADARQLAVFTEAATERDARLTHFKTTEPALVHCPIDISMEDIILCVQHARRQGLDIHRATCKHIELTSKGGWIDYGRFVELDLSARRAGFDGFSDAIRVVDVIQLKNC